jgi:hypothetical protein
LARRPGDSTPRLTGGTPAPRVNPGQRGTPAMHRLFPPPFRRARLAPCSGADPAPGLDRPVWSPQPGSTQANASRRAPPVIPPERQGSRPSPPTVDPSRTPK